VSAGGNVAGEAAGPCPRCARGSGFLASPEKIAEILRETPISPILAAEEAVFGRRLEECEKCDALRERVLCSHCGCFVMFRARPRASHCPHPQGDKWKDAGIGIGRREPGEANGTPNCGPDGKPRLGVDSAKKFRQYEGVEITIIAAMAENRAIGKDNKLPWSLKEDLARFRSLTLGFPCIMGRKTWESLPKRPLPGRPNVVVSRSLARAEGAAVVSSLREALRHCAGHAKAFVCGGASIYEEALPLADRLELTLVRGRFEGDAFFPEIDAAMWKKTDAADFDAFSFVSYARISNAI